MSVGIHFEHIVKKYGDNTIIPDLNLDVKEGEFFTLLGPSGCGKTCLLYTSDIFGSFRSLISIRNGNPNARLSCRIYEALSLKFGTVSYTHLLDLPYSGDSAVCAVRRSPFSCRRGGFLLF